MSGNTQLMPIIDLVELEKMPIISNNEMEEDYARPKATFRLEIENFSKLAIIKEQVLSPPCYVRSLPWKMMIMYKADKYREINHAVGFFLQCNGGSENTSWNVNASAKLRVISQKEGISNVKRKIQHMFNPKEKDFGFSFFMSWKDITDEAKGYIKNDTVFFEVSVTADAPNGANWNSKKHTGHVGLKKNGTICYMNSLLQVLYFTNQLRKAVYKMPTESDERDVLALKRVFRKLQIDDKPVGTNKLARSFGWETLTCMSLPYYDVQQFLKILLDKLGNKMKGTCVEGTIPKLFEGKMILYIHSKDENYTSKLTQTFYDIQFNTKGKKNIYESFEDYVQLKTLNGNNRYDVRKYGLQDTENGVIFVSFPPVLYLHLMRFQNDPVPDKSFKTNDRFEFYDKINLDQYLKDKEDTPADYILHAVLVHSRVDHRGIIRNGHYVVFINPKGDGKWCKFDDDVVSRCPKEDAIDRNFGDDNRDIIYWNMMPIKKCTRACMLVYIRDSELKNVLQEVTINDLPKRDLLKY